ncbi:MAG: GspE/PulE family protein [Butyrivibrio sp.]
MAYQRKKLRLGDLLLSRGVITEDQLEYALSEQKKMGLKLGETLIRLGFVNQEQINNYICEQLDIEFVDLRKTDISDYAVKLVPENTARKYILLPFGIDEHQGNVLKVAMENPMDILAIDDIEIITNMSVQPYLANAGDINAIIDKIYGQGKTAKMVEEFITEQKDYMGGETDAERAAKIDSSPIVTLVRTIIEQAVRQRASDIHIEPFEEFVRVRYRVDGVLRLAGTYEINIFSAIIARIKVISGMDISEKRKPQDGRITIDVDGREYDIRVSNLPTVFGEKVVMRLASKEGFKRDKRDLGLNETDLVKFDNILKNPNGIILVTGPTGSGKSTTLYTALSELANDEVNIITVEDPVEANIDGVNQVQTNVKADLTFASALRSILRQDPDIIMIGEIRDTETAEIAVKASITGHLVVSTLHTNSTVATVSRLIDMGVEPYMLGDSLVGIIAQRLVRRLCDCKKPREATVDEKKHLGVPVTESCTIYEPGGCPQCQNSGYHGRIGVYEIMPVSRKLRYLIAGKASAEELQKAAEAEGMSTLRKSASKYVLDGVTSYAEMMKITYETEAE